MQKHTIHAYQPDWVPAYLSNGIIGLRPSPLMLNHGYATINGFAGADPIEGVESYVYAPYPVAGDIGIDNCWLSRQTQSARFEEQTYDFSCGELQTRFRLQVGEVTAQVVVTTWCARSLPTLAVQEIRVTVNRPCELVLRGGIDTATAQGQILKCGDADFRGRNVADGLLLWEAPGGLSQAGYAYTTEFSGAAQRRSGAAMGEGWATDYAIKAQPNQEYVLRQITSVVPGVMHREPERQAVRMAYLGAQRGYKVLLMENRQAWAELWRGRVQLHGADSKWQEIADACFFYVHSSVHAASPCSTSLFGLGQWPGYHCFRGHVFWDIETFVFPPLLLTAPDSARAIVDYRSRHLQAARHNAAMNGYRGLQFPWESSPLHGEEVTPSGWPIIIYEQHINFDVAFAFAQFAHATNDQAFLREQAWPVLHGVCEWLASRVQSTSRGYELHQTMGICEGEVTDNNAFVNAAAQVVLREAIEVAQRLNHAVPALWREIAEKLFIPHQSTLMLRNDGYDPQAKSNATETLAAFYPYTYRTSPEITRHTLRHYLDKGRAALGWPMLPPLFGVHAARLGERELSLEMFERGVADYVIEPFRQMDEFGCTHTASKPKVGPYLAHAGAFLMDLLFGLPGLQLRAGEPEQWFQFPVVLPQGWEAIEVERIWAHGREAQLLASQGDEQARLKFLSEKF
jgi:trehalose/maltose hydrolase-like predicted phosphorylase